VAPEVTETPEERAARNKHRVFKGPLNLIQRFEETNKDRIDEAVRMMVEDNASNHEVIKTCHLGSRVVQRIRRTRVEHAEHPF